MDDPHQRYQLNSASTTPVVSISSPMTQTEYQVPTLTQMFEIKQILHKLLTKVELQEQKQCHRCHHDATGATQERIILSLTEQIQQMKKDQDAYSASLQQAVSRIERQQHAVAETTRRTNESLSYFQDHVLRQMEGNHGQILSYLSSIQTMTKERLHHLELKLSSENERLNDMEMKIFSKVESVDRNNQQFAMMLTNVQEQAKQIGEALETEFNKRKLEEKRRGTTPDKSGKTRLFSWGSSPSKEHSEQNTQSPSQSESDIRKLKVENDRLQQQIHNLNKDLQRTQLSLEKVHDEKESLKCAVMRIKGEIQGTWAGRKPPSTVTLDYVKLFTNHSRSLRKALKASKRPTDSLVNVIFQVSYRECRSAVLKELFKELFLHHRPDDKDMAVAEDQMRLYGQLLGLKHQQLSSSFDCNGLTLKVLNRVGIFQYISKDNPSSDPRYWFAHEAVKTALDMIVMQPPMVIEYPRKFMSDCDVQEKQPGAWDETLQEGDYELEYFRPILYSNYCAQDLLKPALVGNKPKVKDTSQWY